MNVSVKLLSYISVVLFAAACTTVKEITPVVSYSDRQNLSYSVQAIKKTAEINLTSAVIKAKRLEVAFPDTETHQLYQTLVDQLQKSAREAYTNGLFGESISLLNSIAVLQESYPQNSNDAVTIDSVISARSQQWRDNGDDILIALADPASAAKNTKPSDEKVADFIRGTVTVWVNQGMKLHNGVSSPQIIIGSGFFIDPRGYIITNYHVISSEVDPEYEGFSRLFIKMSDDPDVRIPAKVIGWDPVLDLALIKTSVTVPYVFPLGSSAELDVGDEIFAIGSPAGLERTLTSGIVSADNRRLFSMGSIMQIDAPINHGNSGGPIINRSGVVQAVVFAGVENFEGLNFAIPVEYLKAILPKLYDGGEVAHPWLGAYGHEVKNNVQDDGSIVSGVQVQYILPCAPADEGGLPLNAIITSLNGHSVSDVESLQAAVISCRPGEIVNITSNQGNYPVALAKRPKLPGKKVLDFDTNENRFVPLMGMKLTSIGGSRRKPKYSVAKVYPGSIADESGFSEQDPFTLLNMKPDLENAAVYVEMDVQKRKNGFLESAIGFALPLDSPDYF